MERIMSGLTLGSDFMIRERILVSVDWAGKEDMKIDV
jgi:hypothetical protein